MTSFLGRNDLPTTRSNTHQRFDQDSIKPPSGRPSSGATPATRHGASTTRTAPLGAATSCRARPGSRPKAASEGAPRACSRRSGDLIALIATADEPLLRRRCPGREKLGDGTIAALAAHTADNYELIATFAATAGGAPAPPATGERRDHRLPRPLRGPGHQPPRHSQNGPGLHDDRRFSAEHINPQELVTRLAGAQENLGQIAKLTDQQLDTTPSKDSFRFCDGQRTLEQVLAALLKHQGHQVDTLKAAITRSL